jgi:hypothetical protein
MTASAARTLAKEVVVTLSTRNGTGRTYYNHIRGAFIVLLLANPTDAGILFGQGIIVMWGSFLNSSSLVGGK